MVASPVSGLHLSVCPEIVYEAQYEKNCKGSEREDEVERDGDGHGFS
jgi:hypothetical protein